MPTSTVQSGGVLRVHWSQIAVVSSVALKFGKAVDIMITKYRAGPNVQLFQLSTFIQNYVANVHMFIK